MSQTDSREQRIMDWRFAVATELSTAQRRRSAASTHTLKINAEELREALRS